MTPEQEEQVRRALGSLPPEGPVPDDVAARLDAALADLVAERSQGVRTAAAGDELAARRRRSRWRTGLVAAASVAVLGVGIGTILDDVTLSGGDADQATSGEAASDAGGARELAPEQGDAGADADAPKAADAPDGVQYLATERQDVSSDTLDRDVARVAGLTPVRTAREGFTTDGTGPEANGRALSAIAPCAAPATRAGDQLAPVRLDGQRATLLLRPADDGTREAQIYSCDDGDTVLASAVVPAR